MRDIRGHLFLEVSALLIAVCCLLGVGKIPGLIDLFLEISKRSQQLELDFRNKRSKGLDHFEHGH
jgi:hypothetical protein